MTQHGKLGKLAVKHDPRTFHLADYLQTAALPPIPTKEDWSPKVSTWGELCNDHIGCCTVSSSGHLLEVWSANASTEVIPSDNDIIAAYSAITGYDPSTGANDNGAYCLDVLNYWRRTGIAGRKIDAFASLEPKNHAHIKASIFLFGGVYIGLALPISAQTQRVWSVTRGPNAAPGSWGGHCVPIISFSSHDVTVVTWGALKKVTWPFVDQYCDESYAILSQDFIAANGVAPNAINWSALQSDLGKL